jgi:2'-5' RNA ligase
MPHRLFLGLAINGWASRIESLQKQLKNHLRVYIDEIDWQRLDALHLTLVFIGEVDDKRLLEIQKRLSDYFLSNSLGHFSLKAEKIFLLNHRHIVLNVSSQELFELQKLLQDLLIEKNILLPERDFHAHITIGKINRPNKILEDKVISEINKIDMQDWNKLNIENIYLYESFSKKRYRVLERYSLI